MPLNATSADDPTSAWESLWYNCQLATMAQNNRAYGLIKNAAIAISGEKICWLGKQEDMPKSAFDSCKEQIDCKGRLVTPGLIDCHTHLVYGGNRAKEFEQRLNGASYEEIARTGGGINSTVTATRKASAEELYQQSLPRLQTLIDEGVTTIEIKSGYGLNISDEIKMLRVARELGQALSVDVVTSFLGAHALPPEYYDRGDDYIDLVCEKMLPELASENLADAVDAYCEGIAFSPEQVLRVFEKARTLKLPIKLHAEQLSDLKGAVLAAKLGALSVDHLEYLKEKDVSVLSKHNTVAVLLPGAYYFLNETQPPPIDALRKNKVPMAIASDSNPGSSPTGSLLLMLNMACTLFSLKPEEALLGVTRHAASALGRAETIGTLEIGKQADMVLWQLDDPAELSYRIGGNPCVRIMQRGICR